MTKSTQNIGDSGTMNNGTDAGTTTEVQPVTRLSDLSAQQWKSGIAAWLGWLFDGQVGASNIAVTEAFSKASPFRCCFG